MPSKPKHPCSHRGCPELVESGKRFCDKHYKPERESSSKRGYGSRWRKVSKAYLRRHPLCIKCLEQGKYTAAEVVDHIIPHRGDPVLMWDENNYQALCKRCHDRKTWTEDKTPEYKY